MVKCAYCKKDSVKHKELSFHRFPLDKELSLKWVENMGRENWMPTKYTALCSKHFAPNSIDFRDNRARLRRGHIPTIFGDNPVIHEFRPIIIQNHNDDIVAIPPVENQRNIEQNIPSLDNKIMGLNHDYTYITSEEGLEQKIEFLEERNRVLTQKLKSKNRKEKRAGRRVRSLKEMIEDLV